MTATKIEKAFGIAITATIIPVSAGLYNVVVIHRFNSGNFIKSEHVNQSLVAAQGLLAFYTN